MESEDGFLYCLSAFLTTKARLVAIGPGYPTVKTEPSQRGIFMSPEDRDDKTIRHALLEPQGAVH